MTTTTFAIGQTVYQVDGDWSNGRTIEHDFPVRDSLADAQDDAREWLATHTDNERARVKSLFVRSYEIDQMGESASDGIESMHSTGCAATII